MISPMLCQKGSEKDFYRGNLDGEWKYDGTRVIAAKSKNVALNNRAGIDYTARLPEVVEAVKRLQGDFVLDGEVCYFDARGLSVFTPCQRRCSTQDLGKAAALRLKFPVVYMVFDILALNGENLTGHPLRVRRNRLNELVEAIPQNPALRVAPTYPMPELLFKTVLELGGEGIVLKDVESRYQEGKRSFHWLKVKRENTAVCDVAGYTEGFGHRASSFGALVLTQNGQYVGLVGGGLDEGEVKKINAKLKDATQLIPRFRLDEPYTAVDVDLKVEVRYLERTKESNVFRFPTFLKIVEDAAAAPDASPKMIPIETWLRGMAD